VLRGKTLRNFWTCWTEKGGIYITNAIKYRLSKVKPETNRVSNRPATKMRFLKQELFIEGD